MFIIIFYILHTPLHTQTIYVVKFGYTYLHSPIALYNSLRQNDPQFLFLLSGSGALEWHGTHAVLRTVVC